MKSLSLFAVLLISLFPLSLSARENKAQIDSEAQIKEVLNTQVEAWNRGDIPAFVATYRLDCIFVGKEVTHGSGPLLSHYQKAYPTRAAMGHLAFSDLSIHLLDPAVAVVTAHWHLDRDSAGGGPAGGVFSLVFQRMNGIWKIALDHTS